MIRLAKISDLTDIIKIYNQINIKNIEKDCLYDEYDFTEHIKNKNIKVYQDNSILGFIMFYDNVTWCYIETLVVDNKHRNKGIGKKLIESIKKDKWRQVELCCHISDLDIITFAEKCNFKPSNQLTKWYYELHTN